MPDHLHRFRRYVLRSRFEFIPTSPRGIPGRTVWGSSKVFTEDLNDRGWYEGFECVNCGEQGYAA